MHRPAVSTYLLRRPWRCLLIGWLLGITAAAGAAAGEAPALILQHLTTADGLPQGSVYTTLQDSQGFVWLATEVVRLLRERIEAAGRGREGPQIKEGLRWKQ